MSKPKLKRIPIERFGAPGPLPLTSAQIQKLSDEWGKRGLWHRAWRDIDVLVERFLACDPGDRSAATSAWHHLLMAVGNFKRSAGLILPDRLQSPSAIGDRPEVIAFPAGDTKEAHLACEDPDTWTELTKIPGLGVPTATTVLSALWPNRHVIIDRRDTTAAVGLGAGDLWELDSFDNAHLPDVSTKDRYWELYQGWFLPTVMASTAERVSPLMVERALFRLDERIGEGKQLPKKWLWSDYRSEALRELDQLNTM